MNWTEPNDTTHDTRNHQRHVRQQVLVFTDDKDELLQYTDCSTEEDIEDVSVVEGFGVRLSAAGYMDCTDWTVVDSEEEAQEKIIEWFGITWCEECRAWHNEDTCPDCEETER